MPSRASRARRFALLTLVSAIALLTVTTSSNAAPIPLATQPSVQVRPGSAIEDVVARGDDNNLWYKSFDGSNWGQWTNLGGPIKGRPTVASYEAGTVDILVRDVNDRLMHKYWNGSAWSSWQSVGGAWQLAGDPAVVSWGPGRFDAFARGLDGSLIHAWYNGGQWSSWESLGGYLATDPTPISLYAGHLDIYVVGGGNALYHMSYNGGWSPWTLVDGWQHLSRPAVSTWNNGTTFALNVFTQGTGSQLANIWWTSSTSWGSAANFGGNIKGTPSTVSMTYGSTDTFVRWADDTLRHTWFNGTAWVNGFEQLGLWQMASDPSALAYPGAEDVFALGMDRSLIHISYYDGYWHGWQGLGMPDPYPTSTQYGGGDYSVNTTQEEDNVQRAMQNAETSDDFNAIWNGLAPADQTRVSDYAYVQAAVDPIWPVTDWSIRDVTGTAASTKPTPNGANTILLGSCYAAGQKGMKPLGAPSPTRATKTWTTVVTSKVASNGKTAYKILADIELYPWFRNRQPVKVSMWARTDSSVDGAPITNSGDSMTRDATRAKKMPWYYHLSVWTYAGRPFYWSGLATWFPLFWGDDDEATQWYGDKIPGLGSAVWYRCDP
jgi:hypothetical protein